MSSWTNHRRSTGISASAVFGLLTAPSKKISNLVIRFDGLRKSLPAKPVVVFKPESAHFGDYRRRRSSHFVTGFAGIWQKRKTNQKMLEIFTRFRKRPNASECLRAHPNVSERIQEGRNRSKHVSEPTNTSKNLRKLRTSRKIHKNFANVACVPSLFFSDVTKFVSLNTVCNGNR